MEEHFKNKLKNHKVDWDKEALLDNLKQELSEDKRRFGWRWILLLSVLILATCWGWNSLQMSADSATSTPIENDSVLNEEKNKLVENAPINQNGINLENNPLSSIPIAIDTETKQPNKKEAKLIKSESEIKQKINTDRPKTNTQANLKLDTSSFADLSKTSLPKTTEQFNNIEYKAIEKNAELPKLIFDIQAVKESGNNVALNIDDIRKDIALLAPVPLLRLKELDLIEEQENLPTLSTTDTFQKKDSRPLKNPFYISGSGEIGLVYRSRIFNSDNIEFVKRLENNEETENALFTITTNLNIGYQHTSGWSLQSGLEYMEIEEVFNYKKVSSEDILLPKDEVLYFIVDDMDTLFVRDTSNVVRTEERTIRHFNKHTFYTVPLQVGYLFDLKKAKLITRLGLSYTFAHNFKGRTNLIYEDGGSEISDNNSEFRFELTNRIGLQAGLALEYPLGRQTNIFAIATYRRSPNLTLGVIEQRYHSLSLGAGFKFSLGSSN